MTNADDTHEIINSGTYVRWNPCKAKNTDPPHTEEKQITQITRGLKRKSYLPERFLLSNGLRTK